MDELKRCIKKAADCLDRGAGITDEKGTVIYATDESLVTTLEIEAAQLLQRGDHFLISDQRVYRNLTELDSQTYCCFIDGTDAVSQAYAELLSQWIIATLQDKTNESDKKSLVKNILLENELPGDIPLKAREHHISYVGCRVVYIVRTPNENNLAAQGILSDWVGRNRNDFMLTMDENSIVIVKELMTDNP